MKLRKTQSQTISEFCNDVAKGLMLSAILAQITSQKIGSVFISLIFLYFSVKLRKKI